LQWRHVKEKKMVESSVEHAYNQDGQRYRFQKDQSTTTSSLLSFIIHGHRRMSMRNLSQLTTSRKRERLPPIPIRYEIKQRCIFIITKTLIRYILRKEQSRKDSQTRTTCNHFTLNVQHKVYKPEWDFAIQDASTLGIKPVGHKFLSRRS